MMRTLLVYAVVGFQHNSRHLYYQVMIRGLAGREQYVLRHHFEQFCLQETMIG